MMDVKRLTTDGKSTTGAISPDGNLFAYTVKKEEKQSLWLRPVENEERGREIVPADDVYYSGSYIFAGRKIYLLFDFQHGL